MPKATNVRVTPEFLEERAGEHLVKGYQPAKWIGFCKVMMGKGFYVKLYEARHTLSKYITVIDPKDSRRQFKVRFSNHKPNKGKEVEGDCDFFVGVTNLGVTTTEMAITATNQFFESKTATKSPEYEDALKHKPFAGLSSMQGQKGQRRP